ncbi:peptidoglycan DD-metalloendopeptidase family protein [Sporosarcina sp. FSL K6-1522]|uniref:murein hydrolase activator EnvC family protein n=1 Tax=Sporosarcina sp. FSL K6-1522 TaxID=2921554 RepID=UPI00315ADB08
MGKSKGLLTSIIAVFLLSTTLGATGVSASALDDMKAEQKILNQKKNELNSGIEKKESEINVKRSSIDTTLDQLSQLNNKIENTNAEIDRVEGEIARTTLEIEELRISIADLEKKIEERDEVLRERMRAMQVKGEQVSYLDVLIGANSFADFIDRFSAVNTLMDADRKIMEQQAEDKKQLEEEKALVEQKLAEQEANKQQLQELKKSLEAQKNEKDRLIKQLEAEQQQLVNEKGQLEADLDKTYEVSKELEQKIAVEQNRLAEIARQAEAERKRNLLASQGGGSSQGGSSSQGGGSTSGGSLPAVSSGSWTKPSTGRSTSSFGWRIHPISGVKKQHRGADIANSIGTPVVSAADGVVSYAGQLGTYGNVIMVTHSIEGKIFTTLYAHLSSIGTGVGSHVSKGQLIGKMGNTGGVTGPHLHFELHVGAWTAYGSSAVNPLNYISF